MARLHRVNVARGEAAKRYWQKVNPENKKIKNKFYFSTITCAGAGTFFFMSLWTLAWPVNFIQGHLFRNHLSLVDGKVLHTRLKALTKLKKIKIYGAKGEKRKWPCLQISVSYQHFCRRLFHNGIPPGKCVFRRGEVGWWLWWWGGIWIPYISLSVPKSRLLEK